jgi:hypothetical protein
MDSGAESSAVERSLATNQMKAMPRRDEVLEAIAQEEARLVHLTSERAATEARIKALRDRLDFVAPEPRIQVTIPLVSEIRNPSHRCREGHPLSQSVPRP